MAIPYWILGIIYLLGVGLGIVFFLFNLYHLRRFGYFGFTGFVITILVSGVIILAIIFTVIFLRNVSWLDSGELFDTGGLTDMIDSV